MQNKWEEERFREFLEKNPEIAERVKDPKLRVMQADVTRTMGLLAFDRMAELVADGLDPRLAVGVVSYGVLDTLAYLIASTSTMPASEVTETLQALMDHVRAFHEKRELEEFTGRQS